MAESVLSVFQIKGPIWTTMEADARARPKVKERRVSRVGVGGRVGVPGAEVRHRPPFKQRGGGQRPPDQLPSGSWRPLSFRPSRALFPRPQSGHRNHDHRKAMGSRVDFPKQPGPGARLAVGPHGGFLLQPFLGGRPAPPQADNPKEVSTGIPPSMARKTDEWPSRTVSVTKPFKWLLQIRKQS